MTSGGGFWATVELLTGMGGRTEHPVDPFNDDIEDWLETMANRAKIQQEREKLKGDGASEDDDDVMVYGMMVDCTFSHPPVRSRLEMLMGSNVVRLTDRKYMLRLMARIRQDYENQQQKRIEERQKNELMRTKMMILNRFIPVQDAPPEIRRYPLFQLYLYCDAIIEARQKRQSPKQTKVAESIYRMLYPEPDSEKKETDDEEEEIYMKKTIVNGVEQLIPLTPEETAEAKRKLEAGNDIDNGYVLTQDEYDRLHYETEAIKTLREAQTVEDMYTKAHEILGILYSYADEGRYKKPGKSNKDEGDESAVTEDEGTTGGTPKPMASVHDGTTQGISSVHDGTTEGITSVPDDTEKMTNDPDGTTEEKKSVPDVTTEKNKSVPDGTNE